MQRLSVALAALVFLASGPVAKAQNATAANIFDSLHANNFTAMANIIDTLGLRAQYSNPQLAVTLFAAPNTAVQSLYDAATSIGLNISTVLPAIFNYHVVTQTPIQFSDNNVLNTQLATLNLANTTTQIVVRANNGSIWYLGSFIYGAFVNSSLSITAGNSVIYPIDSVLLPPSPVFNVTQTIDQYLATTNVGNFTILRALIAAEPSVSSITSNPLAAVAVFAPTDSNFQSLLNATNITLSQIVGTPLGKRILQNHVIPSYPITTYDFISLGNTTLPTASPGDTLQILTESDSSNTYYSVQGAGNAYNIYLTVTDAAAGLSSVQVIDGVILPNLNSTNSTATGRKSVRLQRKL